MKSRFVALLIALAMPFMANAAPVSWDYSSGILQPLQAYISSIIKGNTFLATSTTATSTFPNLSASSTRIAGPLYDNNNSRGSNGYVLQSSGSGFTWVATSTLGFTGGAGHDAVTLSGVRDYITLVGQDIVRGVVDISDDTNLAGDSEVVLTGDALSLASGVTRDSEISAESALETFLSDVTNVFTNNDTIGTANISGLDISDDTNLTAGDALTLTGDDIDFDGGTAPGGELGGTWASPTLDDSLAVTSWNLTTPTLTSFFGTPCTGNEFLQDISDTGAFTCVAATGGGGGGGMSTTTDNNAETGETISYITTDFYVGGSASNTAELNFDKDTSKLTISAAGSSGFIGIATTSSSTVGTSGIVVQGNGFFSGNATATNVTATGTLRVASLTGLLKATSGVVSAATAGTDYLTTAITSFNGLTNATQLLATTSANTGWGFTSSGSTHTLNIPTASANVPLGLLSSTDWSTFNSKQAQLTAGNMISIASNIISATGLATTSVDTSSKLSSILGDETGTGLAVFNNNAALFGTTSINSFTATTSTTTRATTTNLSVTSSLNLFGNSTVTTNNALCIQLTGTADLCDGADASGGGSAVNLPSWIVAASGGDFTTIQSALDACGTAGGGWIMLTDASYSQGATGLTFKGSDCHLMGRGAGTTTIAFTGATTLFKTNTPSATYSNISIENLTVTGDGNTSSVAIDISDITNSNYRNIVVDNVGTCINADDTQNITFYNVLENINCTTLTRMGIDASSTNPVNANTFRDVFLGSTAANIVGIEMNNGNGNLFEDVYVEPANTTGTVGLRIFDNATAGNDGVFNNRFHGLYIEGNATGVSVANSVASGGGIQRNTFEDMTVQSNTTDWSMGSEVAAKNTFLNNYDSFFGNPINSIQAPFGVGSTSFNGDQAHAFVSINPVANIARNILAIGSSTRTWLLMDNSGEIGVGTSSPEAKLDIWGVSGGKILTLFSNAGTKFLELTNAGVATLLGVWDFTNATLRIPNSTSLPGTCSTGDLYMDTDATSGQRLYLCQSANTWVLQGDGGGGGGSPGGSDTEIQFNNAGSFGGIASFIWNSVSGRLGLGTTTPYAFFGIQSSTTTVPVFSIASTTGSYSELFSVWGATTTLSSNIASSTNARVVVGNYLNGAGYPQSPFDSLTVYGTFKTEGWGRVECPTFAFPASLSSDAATSCNGVIWQEDNVGTLSFPAALANGGSYIASNPTTATANDGTGMFIGNIAWIKAATNTPIIDTTIRIAGNATSSLYFVGFTNLVPSATTFETHPTSGCYLVASSSQANWILESRRSASAVSTQDTGIASTSVPNGAATAGVFRRFRVEHDAVSCKAYAQSSNSDALHPVATITTDISTTTSLSAGVWNARRTASVGTNSPTINLMDLFFYWRTYPMQQ